MQCKTVIENNNNYVYSLNIIEWGSLRLTNKLVQDQALFVTPGIHSATKTATPNLVPNKIISFIPRPSHSVVCTPTEYHA